MAAGKGLTVIATDAVQPVGKVYAMVSVPAATPVTVPRIGSTVEIDVLLLVQVPPAFMLLRAVVKPAQTLVVPDIDANAFTVIRAVAVQPVGSV